MLTYNEALLGEIKATMARRDLTQAFLVEAWGISQPSVAAKLHGQSALTGPQLEQVAAALGFETVWDFIALAAESAKREAR